MHSVALLHEVADDEVDVCLGFVGVADFFGHDLAPYADLAVGEELGLDEDVGLCAECDFAGVFVQQKDLGLAGILDDFARKR